MKRQVKRILQESNISYLRKYKVENHQHSMEWYHVLVFHKIFIRKPEWNLFKCRVGTIDKVYHLYWRFFSCAMFFFRVADRTCVTSTNPQEKIENCNRLFLEQRKNVDKDVKVLCKLCGEIFGESSCTRYIHNLHHMIQRLIVLKSHSTFEMMVEHFVSSMKSFLYKMVLISVCRCSSCCYSWCRCYCYCSSWCCYY